MEVNNGKSNNANPRAFGTESRVYGGNEATPTCNHKKRKIIRGEISRTMGNTREKDETRIFTDGINDKQDNQQNDNDRIRENTGSPDSVELYIRHLLRELPGYDFLGERILRDGKDQCPLSELEEFAVNSTLKSASLRIKRKLSVDVSFIVNYQALHLPIYNKLSKFSEQFNLKIVPYNQTNDDFYLKLEGLSLGPFNLILLRVKLDDRSTYSDYLHELLHWIFFKRLIIFQDLYNILIDLSEYILFEKNIKEKIAKEGYRKRDQKEETVCRYFESQHELIECLFFEGEIGKLSKTNRIIYNVLENVEE